MHELVRRGNMPGNVRQTNGTTVVADSESTWVTCPGGPGLGAFDLPHTAPADRCSRCSEGRG